MANSSKIKSINQINIADKRVFLRLDLNAPLEDGKVADDTRLLAALPTINYALARSARVILASHLGRPKGKVDKKYSLEPVAARLAELLDHDVLLSDYPVGDTSKKLVHELRSGDILLLENLRFDPGETKNDEAFAQELASYTDIYINDAFGTAHRAHASTAGMIPFVKGESGVGLLMQKELDALSPLLDNPKQPFVAILGGAKVSDKIKLINNLFDHCQTILIGGAMAYTFLKAQEKEIGASRFEVEQLLLAHQLIQKAQLHNVELVFPVDHIVATEISAEAQTRHVFDHFGPDEMGLDIGPKTVALFSEYILKAENIFWNGPMGVFELEPFAAGTKAIAEQLAQAKAYTVIGGGDSASAAKKFGVQEKIDHISTGGGASLAFLEGRELPALKALRDAQNSRRASE